MRRIVIETLLLAFASAVVCLAINSLKRDPLPLNLPNGFFAMESPARPLLLDGARRHFEGGRAAFLDPRPKAQFEAARIEGALSVPFDQWEALYTALEPWIAGRPIVLYAGRDGIQLADDLAGALAGKGHDDSLFVFLGGVAEWREAALPIATGPDMTLEEWDEEDDW